MAVKHLSLEYDKVNERGTFSPGDVLSGRVTVVSSKETTAQRFVVRAKGKAKVTWPEQRGRSTVLHSDKKEYFKFEHVILQDKNKGDGSEIIRSGRSVYPFSFVVPDVCVFRPTRPRYSSHTLVCLLLENLLVFASSRDMPSSYRGKWGRVTYSVRAQLTQTIWLVHKTKAELPFLTKSDFPFASRSEMIIIGLKEPQCASRISFLGRGTVTMNVTSEKMGVKQGEALGVSVELLNSSACALTPRLYLREKQTFVAQSHRIVHASDTLFATGDSVPAGTSHSVTKVLRIPPRLPPTFFNCSMMKLEYRLKVTLTRDQEVRLPLVVLLGSPHTQQQQRPRRSIWFRKLPA
ncbi:arrestin domain-containing protein 3-like isoform X1 [Betta splendens]|uniref:Arrestin domain-containing protein 3-like isoform X1 n=1 Tax=Betta splendens TaxID=158456 RepID=A0A9W2Y1P6_BETSP|nr:arrestin domain-containing protein 3-like isoform X1 [Betta splendens]